MRDIFFIVAGVLMIFLNSCKKDTGTTAAAAPATGCAIGLAPGNGHIIPGQYIIMLNENAGARLVTDREVNAYSTTILSRHGIKAAALQQSFAGGVSGFIARLSPVELADIKKDNGVALAEPDRVIALGDCFTVVAPGLVTWNIRRVGYGDGKGKTAWVIDTGIDFSHPDLNVDSVRSRSFLAGNTSANDENGHGTHVAGIIGAKNNSFGVLGVASGATLVSLRMLDKDGVGTSGGLVQALAYVNSNAKAGDVVNISSGEDTVSEAVDQLVRNTASKGIFIAIAAGNDHKPAINYSPGRANASNIYTVSAIDSLGQFATFSNYGNDVIDYAAPGVKIVSTWIGGLYASASGTSMAAPHVAGLLLLSGSNIKSSGTALDDPDGVPDPIAHK